MKIYNKNWFIRLLLIKVVLLLIAIVTYFTLPHLKEDHLFAKKTVDQKDLLPTKEEILKTNKKAEIITKKPKKSYLDGILTPPKLELNDTHEKLYDYLNQAQATKKQITSRLSLLEKKAAFLKTLENQIDDKLTELEERRLFLLTTMQKEKKLQKDRIDMLVNFYLKMDAKKAAPIIQDMDQDLVLALFKKIPEKQTTRILEAMDSQKSLQISEYIARIGSAKEYELLQEMNKSLLDAFDECKGLEKKEPKKELNKQGFTLPKAAKKDLQGT